MIQVNLLTKQKGTHGLREQRDCQGWGKMRGRDSWGVWDGHEHTAIFKMDNQQGPTLLYKELCLVLCGSLDGRGV